MSGSDDTATGGGQAGGAGGTDPNSVPTRPTPPDFVMDEVKLLLNQLTTPETDVRFNNSQSRANPDTIKNSIHPDETPLAWTWINQAARLAETILDGRVEKVGYQADIDSYFRLDDVTGPVWTPVSNPNATSSLFELSTGASDAPAYHDFYRLQIAFEDVWAELIDTSIGATAQKFYAKWDALMNAGMGSDINGEEYTDQFDALTSTLEAALQSVSLVSSLINPTIISQFDSSQVTNQLGYSIQIVAQVQGNASDAFKSAFDLDMQKIQADLQSALSGLNALFTGQSGAGTPVTNALDAALQIVSSLKGRLSQGAAARTATFNAVPSGDIGGYDELENFLNDVRIILGLPTIAPPSGSTDSEADDYESYFETIALNVKGAIDYLECLVLSLLQGLKPAQTPLFSATINSSIINASSTVLWLMNNAAEHFKQTYGSDLNDINNSLKDATSKLQTLVLELVGDPSGVVKPLNPPDVDTPAGSPGLPSNIAVSGPDVRDSLKAASTSLDNLRFKYKPQSSSQDGNQSAATDRNFPEVETLFKELSDMLKERYRFDVFAPASINYGLLLNYRQKWEPQSYQVGNLAKTIPLGPGETRKYTTKTVVKKSRNAKELNESLRSDKEDNSQTQRADAEIFTNANQKTDFSANASGSFKIGVYDVNADTHFNKDLGVDSKNTQRNLHESVLKSAQEYRDQHRLEVTTDKSSEEEVTSSSEIRNPNDELTVTYLFYELQRRYLVSESLHRATPVILVANDVPAPHEIDEAWLVRHDWILKRVILDDSFLPALAYLGSEFAGQETALIILEMQVQHQKAIVDQLSRQVMLANQALNASTAGVTNAEDWSLNDRRNQEYGAFVKGFFDPLGLSQAGKMDDGGSDRARIDFANEALQRTQAKVNDLNSQMRTELTALQAAVDKYTTAATRHYAMEAQIDRLRLHVKDNIIYYMQAIWSHEPSDQRYFRLYNLDVPVFEGAGTVTAESASAQVDTARSANAVLYAADTSHKTVTCRFCKPTLSDDTKKLHQVADVDNLIGFKGNYMIFPLVDFDNYMAWYLIHNYVEFDPTAGLVVSDPGFQTPPADLEAAMKAIHAQDPASFAANEAQFEEIMLRLLSDQTEQMVIVPSDQLYIEALPGTHPILEDFKLIHRALDVKKVQAEVRHAELENLRLAARLASGEYGDPDVEKKIVVEGGVPVTVNPGD